MHLHCNPASGNHGDKMNLYCQARCQDRPFKFLFHPLNSIIFRPADVKAASLKKNPNEYIFYLPRLFCLRLFLFNWIVPRSGLEAQGRTIRGGCAEIVAVAVRRTSFLPVPTQLNSSRTGKVSLHHSDSKANSYGREKVMRCEVRAL